MPPPHNPRHFPPLSFLFFFILLFRCGISKRAGPSPLPRTNFLCKVAPYIFSESLPIYPLAIFSPEGSVPLSREGRPFFLFLHLAEMIYDDLFQFSLAAFLYDPFLVKFKLRTFRPFKRPPSPLVRPPMKHHLRHKLLDFFSPSNPRGTNSNFGPLILLSWKIFGGRHIP